MKVAFFDCFAGISGDMTLGAILDAGADETLFRKELSKIGGIEFDLEIKKVVRRGIQATDVQVKIKHEHHHRHLSDITRIIEESALAESVKQKATSIFRVLAEAEARVHGTTAESVHFHEVGAVDAIVDIVGACVGLHLLGVERVVVSPLPMGHGWVECQHGRIPLPAPATVEILKGAPVYSANVEGELVTPTGAAIVKTLAHSFGHMPQMRVQNTGYGAGNTEFPFPNLLRVFVGETDSSVPFHKVSIVETNIDDMNPEFYNSAMEKLFLAGALDVFTTPICMKKNRPGALLTVICPEEKADAVSEVVLRETTSFGVRVTSGERRCLDRRWVDAETEFGTVKVKVGSLRGEDLTVSPEYEDCKKAAEIAGVPVRRVYEEAAAAFKRGQKQ
ncbi:MAG: nickel pincer cofactor biosynthesis protein LarC [Armatimonadota bacterium]|jgi:uncharacterized protein (TIGR00299 family) protein